MNNVPFDNNDGHDALSHSLQAAVDTIRCRPVPSAALERSLARASAIAQPADSLNAEALAQQVAHEVPIRRRRLLRAVVGLATIVAVIALAPTLWRMSEPRTSWAQVVAAVEERPWIHLVRHNKSDYGGDAWVNLANERTAWRQEKWLYFEDLKSRLHEIYDPTTDKIVRTPLETEALKMEVFGMSRMLRSLLKVIPDVGSFVFGIEKVVARRDAEIVEDGQKWVEFTLDLERGMLVARVDPRTRLPVRFLLRDGKEADAPVTRFDLEYPADGPADIYAFGAPRTAIVVDCRPPADVAKIRASLSTARESFGDYVAHVVKLYGNRPAEVLRVWRSGKRFRIEMVRAARGARQIPGVEMPAENADESIWITELDRNLAYVPFQLFDGTAMYQHRVDNNDPKRDWVPLMHPGPEQDVDRWIFRPFQSGMPHNYLFPEIGYLYEVRPAELERKPDDGVVGAVRVIAHVTELFPSGGRKQEFLSKHWFDPNRGFACLKHCRVEATDMDDKDLITCYEMDGFRQNLRGVWYPTIVRMCDNEGKTLTGERAVELRLYFDFDHPIPADAFKLSIEPLRD